MDFASALGMTLLGVLVCLVWKGLPRFVDTRRHAQMVLCEIQMRSTAKSDYYCCGLEGSFRCDHV